MLKLPSCARPASVWAQMSLARASAGKVDEREAMCTVKATEARWASMFTTNIAWAPSGRALAHTRMLPLAFICRPGCPAHAWFTPIASRLVIKGHTMSSVVTLARSKLSISGDETIHQAPKWDRHSIDDAAGPAVGAYLLPKTPTISMSAYAQQPGWEIGYCGCWYGAIEARLPNHDPQLLRMSVLVRKVSSGHTRVPPVTLSFQYLPDRPQNPCRDGRN